MPYNHSFLLVNVALQLSEFRELNGSTGKHTYFRHVDGRVVQIDRTADMKESQLREIADQAKIPQELFMDRISTIEKYMQEKNGKK